MSNACHEKRADGGWYVTLNDVPAFVLYDGYCPTCGTGLRADGSEQARVDADAGTVRVAEGELRALIGILSATDTRFVCDDDPVCPCADGCQLQAGQPCRERLLARFGLEVRDE